MLSKFNNSVDFLDNLSIVWDNTPLAFCIRPVPEPDPGPVTAEAVTAGGRALNSFSRIVLDIRSLGEFIFSGGA